MKFSDIILAMASLLLISWSLYIVLAVALVPMNSPTTSDTLAVVISFLVGSLIVGYVFAPKIHEESRIKAILGVVVLSTFVLMVLLMISFASPQSIPWFKDSLSILFKNSGGFTDYELFIYSAFLETLDTVAGLVLFFIGLYAGSMLRKPKKT